MAYMIRIIMIAQFGIIPNQDTFVTGSGSVLIPQAFEDHAVLEAAAA